MSTFGVIEDKALRPRRRSRWWIIGLIIIIVLIGRFSLAKPVRERLRLMAAVPTLFFDNLGGRLKDAAKIIFAVNDVARENNQLLATNNQLQAEVANLQAAKSENERLKSDLNFKVSNPQLLLIPATIIQFSPTGLNQSLVINRGTRDGVSKGQAVVSGGFLAGKINQVSEQTAEVWLLTNRNLLTPVILPNSQTTGILRGGIRGLVIENIPLDTKITGGEPVVTSSLEGLYPANIPVGKVEEVLSLKEEIFLTLRVSSPLNIGNISTLFVIKQEQ